MTRKAQKFYEKASDELAVQIDDCIDNLSQNPYKGADIKKLKGNYFGYWRYRIGNYRVIYYVEEEKKNITIFFDCSSKRSL